MNRLLRSSLAKPVITITLLALALSGCDRDSVTPQSPLTVSVFDVGSAVTKQERNIHGRVVPADLTRVAFRISGKIAHLPVQAGQQVRKGQSIARIEDTIQRQMLADAQAQFELSQRQLQRAEDLFDIGAITPAQRDELNAGFRLARARLELAKAQLSYTTVTAPFDGTIADLDKEVYESVSAGETVVTIYRNERVDVLIDLPDAIPARSSKVDKTKVRLQARFAGDDTLYKLAYLKNTMARSPESQAFRFWFSMPAADRSFPPGSPVTVTLDLVGAGLADEAGLVVPLTALQAAEEGQFRVWRYEEGIVSPVPVLIERMSAGGVLITYGLQSGDRIVTSGLARLSNGQNVQVGVLEGGTPD